MRKRTSFIAIGLSFFCALPSPAQPAWRLEYDIRMSARQSSYRPILRGGDERTRQAAQALIDHSFRDAMCRHAQEDSRVASRVRLESELLSFKWVHYRSCEDEPTPVLAVSGMNIDLRSGREYRFARELPGADAIVTRVMALAKSQQRHAQGLNCSSPTFSGKFYLTRRHAVFVGFFSTYAQSPCETEVRLPREVLMPYLTSDSPDI